MATFKCKMCGGELEIKPGSTVAECTYCGAKQTLPKLDDERRVNLYDRANHFRRNNDFDKAMGIYESILNEDKTEAEAYWGLILCKYGIEYVEDPATHRRVPTCHRASYDAVTADADYQNALQYADSTQRPIYEAEAAEIDEIQRGIIALAQKEDPYDVFICYKETDNEGKRTQDSVTANDVYHQLTMEGFKVFYAAITLEDKLGTEYEPYIFSALNTAKVMLVLGSKVEYFNAVWVKNEWSRFLKIMQKDRSKLLIPCYKDIDPYDLPDEFAHLQAQDMSKIGFINDLVRGIKKVTQSEKATAAPSQTVVVQNEGGANVTSLLDRGNMALEDGEWDKANEFFEQVLNMDSRNGAAYLGQFLAAQKCKTTEDYAKRRINATSEAKSETLTACAEDESRINACVSKNKVEGYLTAEEIQKIFALPRTYSSTEASRKQQLNYETNNLNNHKLLIRAFQFGAQAEVDTMKEKILAVMRKRLSDSQRNSAQSKENTISTYQKALNECEKKIVQMHEVALQKKATDEKAATERAERERIEIAERAERERIQSEKRAEETYQNSLIWSKTESIHDWDKAVRLLSTVNRNAEMEALMKELQDRVKSKCREIKNEIDSLSSQLTIVDNEIKTIQEKLDKVKSKIIISSFGYMLFLSSTFIVVFLYCYAKYRSVMEWYNYLLLLPVISIIKRIIREIKKGAYDQKLSDLSTQKTRLTAQIEIEKKKLPR